MESYYVIQDLTNLGYWDSSRKSFKGILFADKFKDDRDISSNPKFKEAVENSANGVTVVKVYR